jgi:hypothetical protein
MINTTSQDRLVAHLLRATNGSAVSIDLIAAVIWTDRPGVWVEAIRSIVSRLRCRGMVIHKVCDGRYVAYQADVAA